MQNPRGLSQLLPLQEMDEAGPPTQTRCEELNEKQGGKLK